MDQDGHNLTEPLKSNIINFITGKRILIAGGAGFIGGNTAKLLKGLHAPESTIVIADIKPQHEYIAQEDLCDEYLCLDLRQREACLKATRGCQVVFNFAADMGGMGFIHEENDAIILFNNTRISMFMIDSAMENGVEHYLYTSSACVYPMHLQTDTSAALSGLRESDAWPAQPQDAYGQEKLYAEVFAESYQRCYPKMQVRVARLHNIYGPLGSWRGGREKAPAALCRKVICAQDRPGTSVEIWGDGQQTRSFCFIDDCIECLLLLLLSSCKKPLNVGSKEMISMEDMVKLISSFKGQSVSIIHTKGPVGVRGRNSNNELVRRELDWQPRVSLAEGLRVTFDWIRSQVELEKKACRSNREIEELYKKLAESHIVHCNVADPAREAANESNAASSS